MDIRAKQMDYLKVFSCYAKLGNLICINIERDGKFLCGIDLTPEQANKLVNDIMREQISLKDQEKELDKFFDGEDLKTDVEQINSVYGGFHVCPCGNPVKNGEKCKKCYKSENII